jgi:hypothetical protein
VLLGVSGAATWFGRRQEAGANGGRISGPKLLWLAWTIAVWFLVAPIVAFDPVVALPLRLALAVVGGSMWLRGVAELLLLFVFKHWRPPYGIAHDVFTLAALLGWCAWEAATLVAVEGYDRWVLGLVVGVAASLVMEIVYAVWFLRIVGKKTVGDDALWFADPEEARFARLNQVTFTANVPLTLLVLAFVAATLAAAH